MDRMASTAAPSRPAPAPVGVLDLRAPAGLLVAGLVLHEIGLVELWGDAPRRGISAWWHLLPLAVLCLVMVWRRRWPLTCLALGLAVFAAELPWGGSLGSLLALVEIVYAAGLHGRGPVADRLDTALWFVVAGSGVWVWLSSGVLRYGVLAALTVFAVVGTSYWWGSSARRQIELTEVREVEARRAERESLARELHDALSGSLAGIALHAEAGLQTPAVQDEALRVIRATSREAMGELQTLLSVLGPSQPGGSANPDGLAMAPADLDAVVARARDRGLAVDVQRRPDPTPALPTHVAQTAHRVLQESLHNVGRHCPARRAHVEIEVRDALALTIRSYDVDPPLDPGRRSGDLSLDPCRSAGDLPHDRAAVEGPPGRSADPTPEVAATGETQGVCYTPGSWPDHRWSGAAVPSSGGRGLRTMHDRVTALGGTLDAGPVRGGWVVRAVIPLATGGAR